MTTNPRTLQQLGAYWVAQGGRNLGVVGNKAHTKGYHLGRDRIYDGSGPGLGDADYSVQLSRDKAGLTNAASAIDLGRLNGSLEELWAFSRWFAQRCFDGDPGYEDVREVIFWSTARNRVIGWSATAPGQWINDYGDASHKTHTHISFMRDSEGRDKRPLFAPYFQEEAMVIYSSPGLTSVTFPKDTPLLDAPGGKSVETVTDATRRYDVMGQDAVTPTHYLVDDRSVPPRPMRWARVASARDQRSTPDGFFNQGVDAAAKAALTARKETT